jgi:GAF domain-containing protein
VTETAGSRRSESSSLFPSGNDPGVLPWHDGRPRMGKPLRPPSGGTLGRELRIQSEADAFGRLAHELHDQTNVEQTLERIVESAAAVVGCDYAGVLLTRKGNQFDAIIASDPIAEKADRLQVDCHEGPGIAAVGDARTTLVTDTAAEMRWPCWVAGMRDLQLGSVLAVRLWTSQSTLGALNFYACSPRWFDPDAVAVAEVLGRHASIALATARQEESLWQAIDARKLIGQAQGILMERFDLDDERAFEVLRRYSQNTNTKLNEVARILVRSRTLPAYGRRSWPQTEDLGVGKR